MWKRSIPATLMVAGLAAALAPGADDSSQIRSLDPALADTLAADWLGQVTMEPIRVVVPSEAWLDSVTMEPIRVVIPRAESASPDSRESLRP